MEPSEGPVCSVCGWAEDRPTESPLFLPPGTRLHGEYVLGRVLGSGGFGITYLAWDGNLKCKRAIKEYFPRAFSVRGHNGQTVVVTDTQSKQSFEHGRAKFLAEGQALAKFRHPGVVSVIRFFEQNGTSYLVMDYEQGITLHDYVAQQPNSRVPYYDAIELIMPIMDALREVHGAGMLHRDISPDNILINTSGQIKLLDFGSAKHQIAAQAHSEFLALKRGYSPEEQYRTNGTQGYWTDVYALGATLYFVITGAIPPDSLDRLSNDSLLPPSKLGIEVPKNLETQLLKALQIRSRDRFQTVADFQTAIRDYAEDRKKPDEENHNRNKREKLAMLAAAAGCLLLIIAAWLLWVRTVPDVRQFTVEPSKIEFGQSATLRWSVKTGHAQISPEIGAVSQNEGGRQVSPHATTTYTLKVSTLFRSVSRSVIVSVIQPRVPVMFTATPSTITSGESAELAWNVGGNPKSISIEPDVGNVPNTGRRTVSPTLTTTYTLRAIEAEGALAESSAVVSVGAATARPAISFTVDPSTIKPGESATLKWKVNGDGLTVMLEGVGTIRPEGQFTVSPAATTSYKLKARNSGGTATKAITLTVSAPDAPVILSFTADPPAITRGQSSTLHWVTKGAVESVSLDGFGTVDLSGDRVVSPAGTTTYLLAVKGPGGSVSRAITVQVNVPRNPPVISAFSLSPSITNAGQPVTLRWSVTGDLDHVSIQPSVGRVDANGTTTVTANVSTTYVLSAQGPAGEASKSLNLTISNEIFAIRNFSAKPGKMKRGQSARLYWQVSGPVTELSISPSVGPLRSKEGSLEVSPTEDTIYLLTAMAGQRRLTAEIRVKVK
ncbi:MAG: protein kinase [Acidobacteriaceae bacterium]|nr:protein kinase [Acidobacteriaceae bacterium]